MVSFVLSLARSVHLSSNSVQFSIQENAGFPERFPIREHPNFLGRLSIQVNPGFPGRFPRVISLNGFPDFTGKLRVVYGYSLVNQQAPSK